MVISMTVYALTSSPFQPQEPLLLNRSAELRTDSGEDGRIDSDVLQEPIQ